MIIEMFVQHMCSFSWPTAAAGALVSPLDLDLKKLKLELTIFSKTLVKDPEYPGLPGYALKFSIGSSDATNFLFL